jgi:AcrR family transcriptional regulator
MPPSQARDRLLAAAVHHALSAGIADLSLRELAAAIGTSHRMLIYHFGSREGLLAAVTTAVEDQQRAALLGAGTAAGTAGAGTAGAAGAGTAGAGTPGAGTPGARASAGVTAADAGRQAWQRLSDPGLWPQERLFFELYAHALLGRPGTEGFLDGIVESWVAPIAAAMVADGAGERTARADARLAVAVVRGLLLDLLATKDRAGVDEAYERFLRYAGAG